MSHSKSTLSIITDNIKKKNYSESQSFKKYNQLPLNSITHIVISGGNSLSYQKHVQVIHELTRYSIILKV